MLEVIPKSSTIRNNVHRRPIVFTAYWVSFCKCVFNLRNISPAMSTATVILRGSSKAVATKGMLHTCETVTANNPQANKNASRFSSTLRTHSGRIKTTTIKADNKTVCKALSPIKPSINTSLGFTKQRLTIYLIIAN